MLKIALVVAALTLLAPGQGYSGDVLPRVQRPEDVGLSTERLARLTRITQEHVEAGRLPGAVILIARQGKIAYFESFGYRDRDRGLAMTPDALFRIYSMTKPITSVAAMMLQEEGHFQISDPVSRYLPALAKVTVGPERAESPREITIQDLLRHTSGFTYGNRGETPVHRMYRDAKIGSRDDTNAEMVAKLAALPLLYAPGTRFEYGVSTDVLGRVVEVVSGQSLGQFFEQRIFQPLQMRDTAFSVAPDKLGRAAQPWQRPGGTPITPRFDVAVKPRYESGGGGLVGSTEDYLRFSLMLLNGGEYNGARLLGKKTVAFMTADHLGTIPVATPGLGFGLGFQVRRDAGIAGIAGSVGEYGWAGNAGTLFWIDPAEQLIALYMIQVGDAERVALRNQFRSLVEQAIVK